MLKFCNYLVGMLFLLSGFAKSIDSEEFINVLFDYGLGYLSYLGPLLSPTEILLGLAILVDISKKQTAFFSFIFTFTLTLILLFGYFFKGIEDCGCFGEFIELPIWISVIRNAFILYVSFLIFSKRTEDKFSKKWKVNLVIVIGFLAFALSGYTINNSLATVFNLNNLVGEKISETSIGKLFKNEENSSFAIFIFSTNCTHCWNITENVKSLQEAKTFGEIIALVSDNRINNLKNYKDKLKPNFIIKIAKSEFIKNTVGNRVPKLVVIENGVVKQIYTKDEIPCSSCLK